MRIAVGTEKGAYLLTENGADWEVAGPLFPGWKVTAFGKTPAGPHLAAVGSNWFGVGIQRSDDLTSWVPIDTPPAWPEGSDRKLEQIWTFHAGATPLWAPVRRSR